MAALNITAPRFTDDDDAREAEGLTGDERDAIHADLHGDLATTTCIIHETDEVIQRGLAQLQDAINMIPDSEKPAYLEAMEQCPEQVETCPKPIGFMRVENYNAWVRSGVSRKGEMH